MNREPNQDIAVRRIAILLRALPTHTHASLLDRLGVGTKKRVDEELAAQEEIDPIEQYRVLVQLRDDFSIQNDEINEIESEIRDEISIGRSRFRAVKRKRFDSIVPQELQADQDSNSNGIDSASLSDNHDPFAFVGEYDSKQIAEVLSVEHSQTIAVVLASITAAHAAEVLSHLSTDLQQETLARIGQLDQVASETIEEVAGQLKDRLSKQNGSLNVSGRAALQAIVNAMPEGSRLNLGNAVLNNDRAENPDQAPELQLRIFRGSDAEPSMDESRANSRAVSQDTVGTDTAANPSLSVEIGEIDESIQRLPTATLCKALGLVSSRSALLTLCGLPNEISEQAIRRLPRKLSKQVRRGMRSLGDLQLRDIDNAKREVYEVVLRMNDQLSAAA